MCDLIDNKCVNGSNEQQNMRLMQRRREKRNKKETIGTTINTVYFKMSNNKNKQYKLGYMLTQARA